MAVNLDGAFLCFREAARHMIERGEGGSLIAVSSTSAIHGAPGNEAYSASKAGVCALVRGLAIELARHRIRCNTLLPGWTETDLTAPLRGWEKFMTNTTNRTPVRRWGTPADMGPAAVFLADPTNVFHTGDTVVVDGGYTIF
jgi:NAD(P)-dependent dehydrogenase (short-subunit alcohol dehydrogenase family)